MFQIKHNENNAHACLFITIYWKFLDDDLSEKVTTGFAFLDLSQCESLILRELNSTVVSYNQG